jgi:hypothetical protein
VPKGGEIVAFENIEDLDYGSGHVEPAT